MFQYQIILLLSIGLSLVAPQRSTFFRRDYKYLPRFDSFYKVYKNSNGNWSAAFQTCDNDGTQLFYPKTVDELEAVRNLTSFDDDVLVGMRDEFGMGEFITVDGSVTPIPIIDINNPPDGNEQCIVLNLNTGVYKADHCEMNFKSTSSEINSSDSHIFHNTRAFICRKIVEPDLCHTVDKGYELDKTTGKCFKINNSAKSWQEAYMTCFMEGAYLAVFESYEEAHKVREKASRFQSYFIGFRRILPTRKMYTVKGFWMDNGAYQVWDDNNKEHDYTYDCGAFEVNDYSKGFLYTMKPCEDKLPFICQIDAV